MHYYVSTFYLLHVLLVALAIVAAAAAAPQHAEQHPVVILRQESNVGVDGYHYYVETSDGTARQEQGTLKQISEDAKALEVTGSYRYIAPDGLVYTVTYTADEHGFQPSEHVEHPGQGQQ
ncbi:Larval cuticle protein 65Ag2 [Eumeta japonica]|uniref:Larval cuticle protein 65Ag2 n=1 Tax=Eumeta variegata TaxID=151549 RepID=A0A4C1TRU7_EUMVA|nr:Larval cuticle protein 65Ag2 [Eumeta japonica]